MRKDPIGENIDEVENIDTMPSIKKERKKTTEFNHLLERKTFRMLRKYFKTSFEKFAEIYQYKKRIRVMPVAELDILIVEYIRKEFDFLAGLFAGNELSQIVMCLKRVILSDRYNKCEMATFNIDFTSTRKLFNKYSHKAFNEWIGIPTNSILLVHFYLKHGKDQSFLQKDVNKEKLLAQMQVLVRNAFSYLPPYFVEVYSHENCKIINFLN
mmetsp:Transcript_7481/g.8499  ORF Transcript_7481/g.8499 Transcript_7481/m.8499 type:complete len:212 (+) Transcript_7481:602-1237(+)